MKYIVQAMDATVNMEPRRHEREIWIFPPIPNANTFLLRDYW